MGRRGSERHPAVGTPARTVGRPPRRLTPRPPACPPYTPPRLRTPPLNVNVCTVGLGGCPSAGLSRVLVRVELTKGPAKRKPSSHRDAPLCHTMCRAPSRRFAPHRRRIAARRAAVLRMKPAAPTTSTIATGSALMLWAPVGAARAAALAAPGKATVTKP